MDNDNSHLIFVTMTRIHMLILLLFLPVHYVLAQETYSSSSVLSTGQWSKIAIIDEGVYKIEYSELLSLGLDDPSKPRLFGNNNGQLSYYNDGSAADDLMEIPIYIEKGSDGVFGNGDYILFYGQSTNRWLFDYDDNDYKYLKHDYSDTAYYFLTSGDDGRQLHTAQIVTGTVNYHSHKSDYLYRHEIDKENILKSGREWFEPINVASPISITDIPTLSNDSIRYKIRVLGRSSDIVSYSLIANNSIIGTISTEPVNMSSSTGVYAQVTESSGLWYPTSSSVTFKVSINSNAKADAKGWLDYLEIHARKDNTFNDKAVVISDFRSIGKGVTLYVINSQSTPYIWDISDPYNPSIIQYSKDGSTISFSSESDSLKRFVVFDKNNINVPIYEHKIINQNLHASESADMVIVTHPLFKEYADKLATLHFTEDGLTTLVVTPEEIYNEFSGGAKDIVAIRNFLRMKYIRQSDSNKPLKYLMLFGDGSYENKTDPPDNPNYMPTYQSINSNVVTMSYTSDDFFSLLEDGEGESLGTEDIGVGRLPVSDTTEAGIITRKIAEYMRHDNYGDWRNVVCVVADDEDDNTHLNDAEEISALINENCADVEVKKIYLDSYLQNTSATGDTYPDVERAINSQMNAGCLVFNYIGHGNENGLAAERIVKNEDIDSWTNKNRLPLFITATCEFSRFDDVYFSAITNKWHEKKSSGERVLLNDIGGSIALMSTTRISYSSPNHTLNSNIIKYVFSRDDLGVPPRLGDIIRMAKHDSSNDENKRNFTLLGDPALSIAIPSDGNVITDSIMDLHTGLPTDTLRALSSIRIYGHVENRFETTVDNFDGTVSVVIYDKPSPQTTKANDGGATKTFLNTDNVIFSGSCDMTNGHFQFDAIIPKDINYTYGTGRIRYYAYGEKMNFKGAKENIIIGGYAESFGTDTIGPDIHIYLNDTLFMDGGITDLYPDLYVVLSDPSGINISGQSIGHDITATIDNSGEIILNNYFVNDRGDPTSGTIRYHLGKMEPKSHEITIKAWDNRNNSSQTTISFVAVEENKFKLDNLINYPNPMTDGTRFTVGHNRPGEKMKISIYIYDMSGRLVVRIKQSAYSDGYQIPEIYWDGKDANGGIVGNGIYVYKYEAETSKGEKSHIISKLMILRQ